MTMYFNTFILLQIWNELNARKLHGEKNVFAGFLSKSKPHVFVCIVMVLLQFAAVQFAGPFMRTTPLTLRQWGICAGLGFLCIPYGFLLNVVSSIWTPA
jgi:magnesium-transporting ATPase (P-type)